jgi:formylglycine-generating enzyme
MKRPIWLVFLQCVLLLSFHPTVFPGELSKRDIFEEPLTGMDFVWIPGGCFVMGSTASDNERTADEEPPHKVCVNGFWLGRKEVTVGQFRAFVKATGHVTEGEREGFSWSYNGQWEKKPGCSWQKVGFPQDDSHPVVNISLDDARAMASWLAEVSGREYRLPTEAEWEYACRAGTQSVRPWGNGPKGACRYANVADLDARRLYPAWETHDCSDGRVFTAPVGGYQQNDFGLFDTLGNVWEWCEDSYSPQAYRRSSADNPLHRSNDRRQVIRGGSWYSRPEHVRCANRDYVQASSRRSTELGFRLVMLP